MSTSSKFTKWWKRINHRKTSSSSLSSDCKGKDEGVRGNDPVLHAAQSTVVRSSLSSNCKGKDEQARGEDPALHAAQSTLVRSSLSSNCKRKDEQVRGNNPALHAAQSTLVRSSLSSDCKGKDERASDINNVAKGDYYFTWDRDSATRGGSSHVKRNQQCDKGRLLLCNGNSERRGG